MKNIIAETDCSRNNGSFKSHNDSWFISNDSPVKSHNDSL